MMAPEFVDRQIRLWSAMGGPTTCCDLCGADPLPNSGLCLRCHRALNGESVTGRAIKPARVTVRVPARPEEKARSA